MSLVSMIHALLGMVVLVTGALAMGARKKRGWHTWLGELYHWAWLLLAITALWSGSRHPGLTLFELVTPPSYAAALVGYVMGKQRTNLSPQWLYWHIQGLSISYIATITALAFQILPRLSPHFLTNPVLFTAVMVLPGFIGGKFIDRTQRRWKQAGKKAPRATQPAPLATTSR